MDLKEFLSYNKNCLYCNKTNILSMNGSLKEIIGDFNISSMFFYEIPVVRKDFLTFVYTTISPYSFSEFQDVDTLNVNKYNTFQLKSDGYICFDQEFLFKMKIIFQVKCPDNHYCYCSRTINISDKSPNITKGFDVVIETFKTNKYVIMADKKVNNTIIFEMKEEREPIKLPYMKLSTFPCDDLKKCNKKIENMLLLK
jgi:hypothetical protein